MSKLPTQELLWRAEQLQNAGADSDEPLLRYVQEGSRATESRAAEEVTGDKNPPDALRGLRKLMEFLLQRPDELTLQELEFRNELMADYRLASLLRIYEPGVWYDRFCVYLRDDVFPKWKSSSVKKSRARKRGNEPAKKSFKKSLHGVEPITGVKTPLRGKRNKGRRKQNLDHGSKTAIRGNFKA